MPTFSDGEIDRYIEEPDSWPPRRRRTSMFGERYHPPSFPEARLDPPDCLDEEPYLEDEEPEPPEDRFQELNDMPDLDGPPEGAAR